MQILTKIKLISAIIACSGLVIAEINRTAQAGMTFLDIDLGARPAAMGGAFISAAGDPNAPFWNPAGLATIKNFQGTINQQNWLVGIKLLSATAVYGTPKHGTIAFSLLSVDNPDVRVTSVSPDGGMKIDHGYQDIVKQFAVGAAYARQISNLFRIGGQIKWVHEDFGAFDYEDGLTEEMISDWEASTDLIAFDFGTQYKPSFSSMTIALAVRNFASRTRYQLEYFEIAMTFRIGIGGILFSDRHDEGRSRSLRINVDAISPRDYSERLQVGLEYWHNDMLALRAGYKFSHDLENLSAGFGIKHELGGVTLSFDYAYSRVGDIFDDIHRLSLGVGR